MGASIVDGSEASLAFLRFQTGFSFSVTGFFDFLGAFFLVLLSTLSPSILLSSSPKVLTGGSA